MGDVTRTIDCPGAAQSDLTLQYLAGRLPDREARAFEAHYFGCEICAEDVRVSSELRDAYGRLAVAPATPASRPTRTWLPLAAAAAVCLAALGVWQAGRRAPVEPEPPVVRGSATAELAVRIEAGSPGKINVAWPANPDASTYVVRVLSPDAVEVWKSEVGEPRLEIDPAILPPPAAGSSLLVQVEALDPMRRVVATSEPAPLPKP